MKSKKQVRDELMEIKYYHSYRDVFDAHNDDVRSERLKLLKAYYDALMKNAPLRLLHIYYEYYLTDQSQEVLADRFCVSTSCISKFCQQLCQYLSDHSEDNNV
ncbi:MAG: hypothetical protein II896_02595 [Clostridia bacterium]|nr:hypothetical protein [Clostridia bacterium]